MGMSDSTSTGGADEEGGGGPPPPISIDDIMESSMSSMFAIPTEMLMTS